MAKRTLKEFLSGYAEGGNDNPGKKFSVVAVTGSANRVTLTKFGKRAARFFERFTKLVSYTPARTYGAMLCVFGALSLALNFLKEYIGAREEMSLETLLFCTAFALISIPFMVSDKPLSIALQNNSVTDFIFFEFFCIRRMHKYATQKGIPPVFGVIIGAALAMLGALLPMKLASLCVAAMVYLFLTFLSPEFSFFSMFIIMPYLSFDTHGVFLAIMVAVTLISYVRKVISGKRVFYFEQYDLLLFVMLFCILISGIFVKGVESFISSIVMILLGMGYVLASSLVTNRRLADCLIHSVIISSVPVSFIAVIESVRTIVKHGLSSLTGASATFDSPKTLAIFLLVALTFSMYFIDVHHKGYKRLFYALIFIVNFAALLSTLSFWAIVVVIIGWFVYLMQKTRHGSGLFMLLFALFAYAILFLPKEYIDVLSRNEILDLLGFSDAIGRWQISMSMLRDNFALGVGIGSDSFIKEIHNYVSDFAYPNSGNFLLELACEAGVISLCAFLLIYFVRVRHRGIYHPYVKNSGVRKISIYTNVITVMLMMYGVFNYIWADMTMYYLFWCVFGLGSATLRVAKNEFDEDAVYFRDGSTTDASSIDIAIKRG
jgi:hypothetical protein